METISSILSALLVFALLITLFALPVTMAKKRGRSAGGWLALSFFITPLWAAIALAVLGDSKSKICDEILDEKRDKNEYSTNSNDMKQRTGFFPGLLTGFVLAIFIMLGITWISDSSSLSDSVEEEPPLTLFEQPADVIETASFEVQKVLPDGNAIAKSQDKDLDGYYTDPTVLLLVEDNNPYYDKQIVRVPKGKCAYRVGAYQYEPYYGNTSTLPVVRIMSK